MPKEKKQKKKKLYDLLPRSSELFDQPSRRRCKQKKKLEIPKLKCNKEEEEEEEEIIDG
jgi:hypothetical protein